ncbi:MAG: Imm50 family immunity protein [Candidatus Binatia bacterium]
MPIPDWATLLTSPHALYEMYESPPDLSSCDLHYLHIDERGSSVTLGFDTRQLPPQPPADWQEKGFNAFEFYLLFLDVENLQVEGWRHPARKAIRMTLQSDKRVVVSAGHAGSNLEFSASSVYLASTRGYAAAPGE